MDRLIYLRGVAEPLRVCGESFIDATEQAIDLGHRSEADALGFAQRIVEEVGDDGGWVLTFRSPDNRPQWAEGEVPTMLVVEAADVCAIRTVVA